MGLFPISRPARVAVLASGKGSNLNALIEAFPSDNELGQIVLVISNRRRAGALKKAIENRIESVYVPYQDTSDFEADVRNKLEQMQIDVICLAGFMRILSPSFVTVYRGRIINIHPSLLPLFPGLNAQKQAIEAHVGRAGCTVHFVDAGVDTGPKLLQRCIEVYSTDNEKSLTERILVEEHMAYPEALRRLLRGEYEDVSWGSV